VASAQSDVYRGSETVRSAGATVLCDGAADPVIGLTLALLRVAPGRPWSIRAKGAETAVVVLAGRGILRGGAVALSFSRKSWMDDAPTALHAGPGTRLSVEADVASELMLVQTANRQPFAPRAISPSEVRLEERGAGKAQDAARRWVRTIFDRADAPPASRLVVGEVLNAPGRWSSFPPHHHAQPELYYYRFSPAHGYGHAECGEAVHKVREHDVLRIAPGKDHAQCAAPGFHMYYLWAIRHLEGLPYTGFEVNEAFRE
jgi:5-deoxy-glucuronate isomerase